MDGKRNKTGPGNKPTTIKPAAGDAFFEEMFDEEAVLRNSDVIRLSSNLKLREIVLALSNREIIKPNIAEIGKKEYFISPSVMMWPFPGWNAETGKLEMRVHSFDVDEEYSPLTEINNELLSLSNFKDEFGVTMSRGEVGNLIRSLTEFFYEMISSPNKVKMEQVPDYEMTANTLEKANFVPVRYLVDATAPKDARMEFEYSYLNSFKFIGRGGKETKIIIDGFRALQLRDWMIKYFLDKHQGIRKEIDQNRGKTNGKIMTGSMVVPAASERVDRVSDVIEGILRARDARNAKK